MLLCLPKLGLKPMEGEEPLRKAQGGVENELEAAECRKQRQRPSLRGAIATKQSSAFVLQ